MFNIRYATYNSTVSVKLYYNTNPMPQLLNRLFPRLTPFKVKKITNNEKHAFTQILILKNPREASSW